METMYKAMIGAANDKYSKVIEYIYELKSGKTIDYEKLIKLINSNHNDEIELIVNLCNLNRVIKELTTRTELEVPSFMK